MACLPRYSGDETRDAIEGDPEDALIETCRWPLDTDQGLQLGDARRDLDEAQTQGIELDGAPRRAFGHGISQTPHQPIGPGVEEQTHLIGAGPGAGCAVSCEMGFPGFDVVLGLPPTAIDLLVEPSRRALLEAGDDKACVGTLFADFDAGDDPFNAAPASGAVMECLEAAQFAVARGRLKACPGAGFQIGDVAAQG